MSTHDHDRAGKVGAVSSRLASLDPATSLDDLEPLRQIVGDARVVALGEGCHFVREFGDARRRLIRFLTERCGFTAVAWEFGVREGRLLGQVLQHGSDPAQLTGLPGTTSSGLDPVMAGWLFEHFRSATAPLEFLGLDTPVAGGTIEPVLTPLLAYLREVDPEMVPTAESVMRVADQVAGGSVALAAPRWAALDASTRDSMTAGLSRLSTRMRALAPLYIARGGETAYTTALTDLECALHTDYMFSAMAGILVGESPVGDASVRDSFMASTLVAEMERAPQKRFVLVAHNQHVQKSPVHYDGALAALPLGHYLADRFEGDYRALALTHTANRVPEMMPDASPEVGFSIVDTQMAPPSPGSLEGCLHDAGLAGEITLTDLSALAHDSPTHLRAQSDEIELPVAEAFDAVLTVPGATTHFTARL